MIKIVIEGKPSAAAMRAAIMITDKVVRVNGSQHRLYVFSHEREKVAAIIDAEFSPVVDALRELYAVVQGECPSLLNEDSGGSARLDDQIRIALGGA